MDDRLIYAGRRKLRGYQLGAIAVLVALPLTDLVGVVELDTLQWVVAASIAVLAALTIVGLEMRIRRPAPEIRLLTEGIEGAFGLIRWEDVTGAELTKRLRPRTRGVVIRLRPRARLWPGSRQFAGVDGDLQRLLPDRLELATSHLELTPQELLREIERFRMYASPNGS